MRVPWVISLLLLLPRLAHAQVEEPVSHDAGQVTTVRFGGYVQPQVRMRENDEVAQFDEDGFRLRRSRLVLDAERDARGITVALAVETELTPEFQLLDAYLSARRSLPRGGRLQIDAGQVKAPFSRQTLVSDAQLQLIDKARLTALAPDRQLGVRALVSAPAAPWLELAAGVFNGEGRNQLDNIDEHFLFAGRLAIRPIGPAARLTEGALGDDAVSLAVSAARNIRDLGSFSERSLLLGVDAFVSLAGFSATLEYLWARYDFPDGATQMDYRAQGLNAQAGYLLPLPGPLHRRLEVTARFEELDPRYPNDVFGILGPADEFQATRSYVAGLSYYHDGHDLKVQLAAAHNVEVEDRDRTGNDATFADDQVLVQATLRLD